MTKDTTGAAPHAAPVVIHRVPDGIVRVGPSEDPSLRDPDAAAPNCLAVQGDRVLATGTEGEVREALTELGMSRAAVELVDHEGAALLPGFTDAHVHTLGIGEQLEQVDLRGTRSLAEALERIREHASALGPDEWVLGSSWDQNAWTGAPGADRWSLDSVVGGRPALISSIDLHSAWASSEALRRCGIHRGMPAPTGGAIAVDASGEPTGILREEPAVRLVTDRVPGADTPAALGGLVERAHRVLLARGITSVHDFDGERSRTGLEWLREQGRQRVRVHQLSRVEDLETVVALGRRFGDGDEWISTGPVKLFSDGALGSHSCHMLEPLVGADARGIAVTEDGPLREQIATAMRAGIGVATHAIGDLAGRRVLDAYAAVRLAQASGELPPPQVVGGPRLAASSARAAAGRAVATPGGTGLVGGIPPLRLEHAQLLHPTDVPRLAALGVVASMQTTHCTSDMTMAQRLLGDREIASYAWQSVLATGAVLMLGSDAPVEDPSPFHSLHAGVTRQRPDGTPPGGWQPEERLTLAQAWHGHTLAPALVSGEAGLKGELRPGMLADFVVVDTDPLVASPAQLRATRVLRTVVGGRVAHEV